MTEVEFSKQTKRLCDLYNKSLNDEQLSFWYSCLKDYDLWKYTRAIGMYAKKNKYMPTISDLLEIMPQVKPYEVEEVQKVECKACKGTGYVLYHKTVNGISYEYAALCNCANANGKEYDGTKDKEHKSDYYLEQATKVFGIGG